MQRFHFRLERVLNWQGRVCRIEEEKLRQAAAEVAETDEKLAQLAAQRAGIEQEFCTQALLAPPDLRALAEYRKKAVGDRQTLEQERRTREAAVGVQREKVLAERRKLEVIEKLRERALQEYILEADREMEALSHESYVANWVNQNRLNR
jgi:flagellar export protein FliJ